MTVKPVKKAIFPVAGLGTRFLPATKAIPKELLPILDRPLIQYAVDEAIASGIDTLVFVTSVTKRALEDHFTKNDFLEKTLVKKNKLQELKLIKNILPDGINCIFIRQKEPLGLGHAILCEESAIKNEPFAVLLADELILDSKKYRPATKTLIEAFESSGVSQVAVQRVNEFEISNYGVLDIDDDTMQVRGLVEKPEVSKAPSNLACVGRYVLGPNIFEQLKKFEADVTQELQLTDALNLLAKKKSIEKVILKHMRFDCGTIDGYLDAISHMAKARDK